MRENFTKRSLEALEVKADRYQIMDATTRGLGVLVLPSGQKSFFHVRKIEGRPVRRTLGTVGELPLDSARGKADELNSELAKFKANDCEGPNPITQDRTITTFAQLVERYIERVTRVHANNPVHAERRIRWAVGYVAGWNARRIGSITRTDVEDAHHTIAEKHGDVSANRFVAIVKTLFFFAESKQIFEGKNPARKIRLRDEGKRDRFLDGAELARLFAALPAEKAETALFVKLALFTGARAGDVNAMHMDAVDLDAATWKVPNQKEGNPYTVALPAQAVEALRERKAEGFVFPSWTPCGHKQTARNVEWHNLCDRAKVNGAHIHDMRHTLATFMAQAGASNFHVACALGHKVPGVTGKYVTVVAEDVRGFVQTAVDRMTAQPKPKPQVVPMRKRKSA